MSGVPTLDTTHTPGPWHWDSDPVKGDPLGRVRYRICTLGKTITQVYYSSFEGGLTNAAADARLIAAAPDLLAALQLLHDNLEEYQRINKLGGYDNHDMVMARAAIKKALGHG